MSIELTWNLDEIQLADALADGWTHLELFYAPSADGDFSTTTVKVALAADTTEYDLGWNGGNASMWFKVVYWDGASNSDLSMARPFPGGGGTTLATLTERLGRLMRDYVSGTTTSTGNTTDFYCTQINVARQPDGHYKNWLWRRRGDSTSWSNVTAWTQATGKGVLSPAVTSVTSGTSFEMFKRWTPEEYREAINWAIVNSYPYVNRQIVYTGTYTAEDTFRYQVPGDIRLVTKVEFESNHNLTSTDQNKRGQPWRRVAFEQIRDGLTLYLEFKSEPWKKTGREARRIRIHGDGPVSQMYDYTDFTELLEQQADLIILLAAHRLYALLVGDQARSDNDRYESMSKYYLNMYESMKNQHSSGRRAQNFFQLDSLFRRPR